MVTMEHSIDLRDELKLGQYIEYFRQNIFAALKVPPELIPIVPASKMEFITMTNTTSTSAKVDLNWGNDPFWEVRNTQVTTNATEEAFVIRKRVHPKYAEGNTFYYENGHRLVVNVSEGCRSTRLEMRFVCPNHRTGFHMYVTGGEPVSIPHHTMHECTIHPNDIHPNDVKKVAVSCCDATHQIGAITPEMLSCIQDVSGDERKETQVHIQENW